MEYFDILNKEGQKTGEIKSRPDVHADGTWHRVVHIFFLNSKNEILLQHRAKDKEVYPDMWDLSSAGHISSGETSMDACIRESKEELGVNLNPKDFKFLGELTQNRIFKNNTYIDNEFIDVYLIKVDLGIKEFSMTDGEVQAMKWVPLETLKSWVADKKPDLVPRDGYTLLFKGVENI